MEYASKTGVSVFLLLGILWQPAYASPDIKEGYDENTEVTVRGTVKEVVNGTRGPVILKIRSDSKMYRVITAPPWYLSQEGVLFQPGSEWEIKGSRYFGRDGNLYLVCRQMKDIGTDKAVVFRDSSCKPKWMGRRMHKRHMQ